MSKECSVDRCTKVVIARGWCTTHYKRWQRNGHLISPYYEKSENLRDYLLRNIKIVNGCWEWTGFINNYGYGLLDSQYILNTEKYVHRISYIEFVSDIPKYTGYDDGVCILHKCDNPPCINPDHLFAGSHLDNRTDMVSKGRQRKGEESPASILKCVDVIDIRERMASGEKVKEIARHYNVSRPTIYAIKNKKIWKHI